MRLLRTAVAFELSIYGSLGRWLARRPKVAGTNPETFGYAGIVAFAIWVFIVLSAIEVPAAHLLIPWQPVRIAVLVLGVWGLTWMFGYLAGLRMHPHVVCDEGLHVRSGPLREIVLPWSEVASVRSVARSYVEDRGMQFLPSDSGTIQALVLSNQTNVDVVLRDPRSVVGRRGAIESVTEMRFWADEPAALARSARARLALAQA